MEVKHEVGLTSTEIAWLWSVYINDTMSVCIIKHLKQHNTREDVDSLLQTALEFSEKHVTKIRSIFTREKFPIPSGFTEQDVDLTAPALFYDLFPVSFVYGMSRIAMVTYARIVSSVAREDIRKFFSDCMNASLELYNRSIEMMLFKGIYDRPPMIPYPDHVDFIKKKETFLSVWLERKRPLNVIEISEMFFNIERNYFGLILLTGLIQVVKDQRIKEHLMKGKELAQKQIDFFNKTFVEDDLLGTIMVNSEVSTSTTPPFSDKLVMYLITTLHSEGVAYTGHALSVSSRIDLVAEYSKLIPEIVLYGKAGIDIMVEYGWMEQPPHAPDRVALAQV